MPEYFIIVPGSSLHHAVYYYTEKAVYSNYNRPFWCVWAIPTYRVYRLYDELYPRANSPASLRPLGAWAGPFEMNAKMEQGSNFIVDKSRCFFDA